MRTTLAALLALLSACSPARTEVLLVIDTDLDVPSELDEVRVDLIGPNGETRRSEGSVASAAELPRTLAVVDNTHAARSVRVTVTGLLRDANVIQRRAVFELVPRETRILRVDLLRSCVGVSCPPDETCAEVGCRPVEVAPEELVPYEPNRVDRFDGGGDAGPGDGGCVVLKELCNDADDDCDGEVDEDFAFESDVANCGACGNACASSPDNAASACEEGACVLRCDSGFLDCNGLASDGCESDRNRPATCGACDVSCAGGTPFCMETDTGETCVERCEEGSTACEGSCVDLTSDPRHCGTCDRACTAPPNAVATCMAGDCAFECDPGYADCDGDPANGCESMLRELDHCGRCGERCERPGAVASCATGTCQMLGCAPLFGDCDGDPGNGCEEDLSSSLTRCGGCDTACTTGVDNGEVACVEGRCRLTCSPGFGNCDGDVTTGCEAALGSASSCGMCGVSCTDPEPLCQEVGEGHACRATCTSGTLCGSSCVDTTTDPGHCGGCGNACSSAPNALASCQGGSCALDCASGWASCDGDMGNGCEASLSSVTSCGGCGNVCPSGPNSEPTCTGGTCGLRCAAGFADCNGLASDGCEVALGTDLAHCGRCNNACTLRANVAEVACVSGACEVVACAAPAADCDGSYSNGCEIDTSVNKHHCGGCGTKCTGPRSCCGGECRPRAECS